MWINILEARGDSRFYRVLLKLLGMHTATGSQGTLYSWSSCIYLGFAHVGFRYSKAVFILITKRFHVQNITLFLGKSFDKGTCGWADRQTDKGRPTNTG